VFRAVLWHSLVLAALVARIALNRADPAGQSLIGGGG
jgi:hypothetical protein